MSIALAAGLLAQSPAQPQQTTTAPAGPQKITVTGCVERADQVTPTGATVGSTVDSLDFVLLKPKEGPGAATATGTTGSTATGPAAAAAGPMYRLDAAVGTLNPHVGHKVEIAGRLEGAAPDAQVTGTNGANAPKLKVDSIKMIAPTCGR